MKIHSIISSLLFLLFFFTCSQNDPAGPKPLKNVGEQVFGSIDMDDQTHINVKNDSGGVYIYGYWNQDVIETMLYQALLESAASEHSARMMAMRNASDAAGDMLSDLTFTYNQIRQASITQEIAEISSGKAALEK